MNRKCPCGKRCMTEDEAQEQLDKIKRRRGSKVHVLRDKRGRKVRIKGGYHRAERRAYPCPDTDWWHLTSERWWPGYTYGVERED